MFHPSFIPSSKTLFNNTLIQHLTKTTVTQRHLTIVLQKLQETESLLLVMTEDQ